MELAKLSTHFTIHTKKAAGLTCGRKLHVLLGGRLFALWQHQLLSKILPVIVDLVFSPEVCRVNICRACGVAWERDVAHRNGVLVLLGHSEVKSMRECCCSVRTFVCNKVSKINPSVWFCTWKGATLAEEVRAPLACSASFHSLHIAKLHSSVKLIVNTTVNIPDRSHVQYWKVPVSSPLWDSVRRTYTCVTVYSKTHCNVFSLLQKICFHCSWKVVLKLLL